MDEFKAILAEGLFYELTSTLRVEKADGEHVLVDDLLQQCMGQKVQIALHHFPPDGVDDSLPGGGSCVWGGAIDQCPAGHWKYPDRLLAFHLEGVLRAGPWRIEQGAKDVPIPLVAMPGHFGRLTMVTVLDLEQMRGMSPEDLAKTDLSGLHAMLDGLRKATRKN